jgi:hypothetical protein
MPEREVLDLAEAVADGDPLDWGAAQSRLATPAEHRLASGLQTISRVSAAFGALRRDRLARRRLSVVFEAVRLMCLVCTLIGGIGFVGLVTESGVGRYLVMMLVLASFSTTAAYLDAGAKDGRARALAFCFWTTAAAFSARGTFWLLGVWPHVGWLQTLFALRPEAFFAAGVWQFAREFPAVTRFSVLDWVCSIAVRVATVLGAALFAVNLAPLLGLGKAIEQAVEPFQRLQGKGPIFWDLVFGMALLALIPVVWRWRQAEGPERARVRFFLNAIALGVGPLMIDVVAQGLVPRFYDYRSTLSGFVWGAMLVYPLLFVLPIATAYAIAASNVLGVGAAIRRGLRYLLARWLVLWGAAIPIIWLLAHVYRFADRPLVLAIREAPGPVLLWLSLGGLVLLACRRMLVGILDRWALPNAEEPSAMLAQMSERMKHARTPLEVASTLARAAERALQAPSTAYLVVDGTLSPAANGWRLPPSNSVIPVLLDGSREPCVVSPRRRHSYYALLMNADREWIDGEQIEVVVPLISSRIGGLLAVVALASRHNAMSFSQDDLRFLRACAAAASLACDAIATNATADVAGAEPSAEVATECIACGRLEPWKARPSACVCGGQLVAAFLPKHPVPGFQIERRLGSGGMGIVYLATDQELRRPVAIKTLPYLTDYAAERLIEEARTMARLSHPQIATLYGAERWRGTPLLTMEFLSEGTLADRLRGGALPATECGRIVGALAIALEYVHGEGLYHGDIKPSNIGFSFGEPKFLDFGLSRAVKPEETGGDSSHLMHLGGTPAYLSPEVREGAAPGPALDIWAMGLILCESLLGTHPFARARTNRDVTRGTDEALAELRERAPHLRDIVGSCLSIDPARRPSRAIELAQAIATVRQS